MITIEKVSTRETFAALEGAWNELLTSSTSNTVMLTHQWISTWWDVFGEDRELCLLLARDGDELIGIAPFLKRTVRHYGVLPFRRIEFLASGEDECDEICSDYLNFILAPGREKEALQTILDYLLREETEWDELLLTDVAGESPNLPLVQDIGAARGLSWQLTREQICIYVPLPDSHDKLLATMSGQNRKRIIKDRRELADERVQIRAFDSLDGFEAAFDSLVQLHQQRWTARGMPGSFSSAKFMRFHREVAPKLLRQGWAKLWLMEVDGEPICALYDFVYANKIFYYQSGMKIGEGPVRSPGLLLRDYGLEEAIGLGISECDFLKGDEGSYKFGWGPQTRPIVQVRLARRGAKEAAFRGATGLVNGLRPLKRQLQGALRGSRGGEKTTAPES